MQRTCVVFDLDDTLYLERDYVQSGFQAVGVWAAKWLGIADFFERAWCLFLAGERGNIFDQVLSAVGCKAPDALVRQLVLLYRTHVPRTPLPQDAAECLDQLRGRCAVSILTDGPTVSQVLKIQALGLASIADPVVITDGWGREYAKPDVRPFEFVQRSFAGVCDTFVYVGDNPQKDFGGPRALGWRAVRIRRTGGIYTALPDQPGCRADYEIIDLREVNQLVR